VRQRVRVYAEADGVIAHLGVREGIFVTPANEVMSIAELDKVWVLAEVFEREAAWVKPGQMAMVQLDYLPGKMWHGTVDYVYPELDPKTRTLTVRIRFDNEDEMLRPNMFARVTIHAEATGQVVHVPREAVIRGGNIDRVVIALGEGRFRARPVGPIAPPAIPDAPPGSPIGDAPLEWLTGGWAGWGLGSDSWCGYGEALDLSAWTPGWRSGPQG
jgi:Cu(I)/Ag(I) efflux system membrane fusion protein